MTPSETLCIQFDCDGDDAEVDLRRLETLVGDICREQGCRRADIDISLVDDAGIIAVHRQFLNSDATTDVISFDLTDAAEDRRSFQIVVNVEMARRQSARRGHAVEAEVALYITHGLLHQLGFDDITPSQAEQMHQKEDAILQTYGYGIIYHHDETETE
jgi:probable rRNA maturation factor